MFLTRIARGGLLIAEDELYYQLQRHGVKPGQAPGLLADLQQRGLIESQTHYRLYARGRRTGAGRRPPGASGNQPHALVFSALGGGETPRAPRSGRCAPGNAGQGRGPAAARIPLPGLAVGEAGRR